MEHKYCPNMILIDYDNHWDEHDADAVAQACSAIYETTAKCEKNLLRLVGRS